MNFTRTWTLTATLACASLSSCQTFDIHRSPTGGRDAESIDGVPFYRKIGVLKQETKYARTWIEVQVEAKIGTDTTGPTFRRTLAIDPRSWDGTTVDGWIAAISAELKDRVQNGELDFRVLHDVMSNYMAGFWVVLEPTVVEQISRIESTLQSDDGILPLQLLANTVTLGTEVDYGTTYYFNSKTPPFGTASGTIELDKDGTLSTGTAAVDSTKLADLLPLKEFLASKLVPVDDDAEPESARPQVRVTVRAKPKGYLYVLQRTLNRHGMPLRLETVGESEATVPALTPEDPRRQDPLTYKSAHSVVRTELSANAAKPKPKPNQATFQGSVTLPKK